MDKTKLRAIEGLVVLAVLLLLPTAGRVATVSAAAAETKPISMTIAYTSYATQYGPLYIAEDLGLFKKHGLDVKLQFVKSSSQVVSALVSNSADVVIGSGEAALSGIVKGVTDIRIIGQIMPSGFLEVWTQPDVNSAKDLIGKTITSTSPGSLGDRLTAVWLRKNGVDPSKVKIVYVGSLSGLIASVRSGSAAATLINPPLGQPLQEYGKKLLGDLRDIPYAGVVYMTTNDYAKKNGEALVRMFKSTAEAISILKTQPDKVLPILAKWTKTENPEYNRYGYEFYKPVWNANQKVAMDIIKATQDVSNDQAVKKLDAAKYVDNSFAGQVEESGFLGTLRVNK